MIQTAIRIDHIDRLGPILQKKKRVKILVGGRASTKSTVVADKCLSDASAGRTWCCGREYQNSIDDSVHSLLVDEIDRLDFPGFVPLKTEINHPSTGGRIFYRGLARNIMSLKGINCDVLWMEEGESLSANTLRVATASVRVSAKEQQLAQEERRDVIVPEIWITMNRGSSKDAISQHYLKRAEKDLARCGYYEDDLMIVIEVNYDENPWFKFSGLESERADDQQYLSPAAYEHKWHGAYSDTIENAIIEPEWFDACIDAHTKLGFKAEGIEVVAHDPADNGNTPKNDKTNSRHDPAALAHRHGSVIVEVLENFDQDVNENCDWSLAYTHTVKPDAYVWDAGGMGTALKRDVHNSLGHRNMQIKMFEGQSVVDCPDQPYEPTIGTVMQAKTNREAFLNRRAQRYWQLRDRVFRTFLAVRDGKYTNPDELISFCSDIKALPTLRAELCRIPRKPHGMGKIQIMSKPEMKGEGISSPNTSDCVMMTLDVESFSVQNIEIKFSGWGG